MRSIRTRWNIILSLVNTKLVKYYNYRWKLLLLEDYSPLQVEDFFNVDTDLKAQANHTECVNSHQMEINFGEGKAEITSKHPPDEFFNSLPRDYFSFTVPLI